MVATAEERRGVVEQAQVGQEPIEAAIRRIPVPTWPDRLGYRRGIHRRRHRARAGHWGWVLERGARRGGQVSVRRWHGPLESRTDGLRWQSGQVWVRTARGRLGQRQPDLLGASRAPTQPAQALADGLFIDAQPVGDGAVGQAGGLELVDHAITRGPARAAFGEAPSAAQPRQAPLVEAPLTPSNRPRRAPKRTGHVILVRPAVFDQADHRVGFGHPIAGDEVRQRDTGDHDDSQRALDAHHAPLVDDDNVSGSWLTPKQPSLCVGVAHGPYDAPTHLGRARLQPDTKKRTGLGPHPSVRTCVSTRVCSLYVRRSELRAEFRGATMTSDAGLLLPRQLDERLGLDALIERHLDDPRTGDCEDTNDGRTGGRGYRRVGCWPRASAGTSMSRSPRQSIGSRPTSSRRNGTTKGSVPSTPC